MKYGTFPDLTGQRFGKIVVLNGKAPNRKCLIRCDCGEEKLVSRYDVLDGDVKSCGSGDCRDIGKNLQGYTFSFLTVIGKADEEDCRDLKNRCTQWNCKCVCGTIIVVPSNMLFSGKTKSCGCKKSELISENNSLSVKESIENSLYAEYKTRSKKSNMEFALSKNEFMAHLYENCFYCGSPPLNFVTKVKDGKIMGYHVNGIDRVDNSKGYTKENSVPCCKICNMAKHTSSITDFFDWLKRINSNFSQIIGKIGSLLENK